MPIRQSAQGSLAAGITVSLGAITVDTQNFGGTATWNNAAITFTAIKLNVTDTASNSASLLMDLQVAAGSKFKVDKGGNVTFSGNVTVGTAGGSVFFTNGSRIDDAAGSGLFRLFNSGAGAGLVLNVLTNGTLAVRTSNNGADGALTASAGTFSGAINSTASTINYLGLATGLVNVMAVAPTPAITAYTTGAFYLAQANITNTTTTPTLNINGLGAKTIVKRAATALAAGDYVANMMCLFVYDGTNMELLNPVVN